MIAESVADDWGAGGANPEREWRFVFSRALEAFSDFLCG
jgi:hypothetical protein